METFAVVLVLFSAVLHALREYLTKKSLNKQVFSWSYRLTGLVLLLPIFLYYGGVKAIITNGVVILASGIAHALYYYTLAEAYKKGDLSLVYPIARSAPIFVLLWSTLIWHDPMTATGILGVIVVVFGSYLLQLKKLSWHHLTKPFIAATHNPAIRLAWLTAMLVAAYSLVDDRGMKYVDPLSFFYLFSIFSFLIYTPYIFLQHRQDIKSEWDTHWFLIISAGIIGPGGYLLALVALQIERVSYVTSVRQISIVLGVIFGSVLLNEKHGFIRMFASTVIVVGVALITIFG